MSEFADPKYHTVKITVVPPEDPEDLPEVEVHFTCTAPEDGVCRTYPECDCEIFSHGEEDGVDQYGHPYLPGRPCWVKDWFDAESIEFTGDDATGVYDHGHPAIEREGHIGVMFDEYLLEWDFVKEGS